MKVFWIAHNFVDRLDGPECIVDVSDTELDRRDYETMFDAGMVELDVEKLDRTPIVLTDPKDIERQIVDRVGTLKREPQKDPVPTLEEKVDALIRDGFPVESIAAVCTAKASKPVVKGVVDVHLVD
jgi:hypothetical protein